MARRTVIRLFTLLTFGISLSVMLSIPAWADPSGFLGEFDLNQLADSQSGAILQGFELDNLFGSSMLGVPDLRGDGADELLIGARFGNSSRPSLVGRGWGEAFLIHGDGTSRLTGVNSVDSIGDTIPGLTFRGIRSRQNNSHTAGLSDITVIDDMDGDDLPELVFSFPRVESVSLRAPAPYQHPDLVADIADMGTLEYDAIDYAIYDPNDPDTYDLAWMDNTAQFTRGGIVIVSSQNEMLRDPNQLTRKFDRVLDLHEIGQVFTWMERAAVAPYVLLIAPDQPFTDCADCIDGDGECGGDPNNPAETEYERWTVTWDVWLGGASASSWQGPGGFHTPWTVPPTELPLANFWQFPYGSSPFDPSDPCDDVDGDQQPDACGIMHVWRRWYPIPGTGIPPGSTESWADPNGNVVWTGFYGGKGVAGPRYYYAGEVTIPPTSIGARVLGQQGDDQFGAAIGSDGTWLYISAPDRTALVEDVPALMDAGGDRDDSGVVYQLWTDMRFGPGQPNLAQLWIEPGVREDPNDPNVVLQLAWPYVDAQVPDRTDYTMPVPHQYIIETVGSTRGNYDAETIEHSLNQCPGDRLADIVLNVIDKAWAIASGNDLVFEDISAASEVAGYFPYPVGTAGFGMDRTPQVVGPHTDARVSSVRGLDDINADGIRDFAVGSQAIEEPDPNDPDFGSAVGAIYIVYGRSPGMEGDYLLEKLQLHPSAPDRLRGVMLKGATADEMLARAFDDAGDFNGDGVADVIVGNEAAPSGGEAIVVLGSALLESPEYGWTISGIVSAGHAIRFGGATPGELAGANVAGVGDVDGDGRDDVLIAAPGAAGGQGAVYLVYGSESLSGDVSLSTIGSMGLPGAKFIGRAVGDQVGGGVKSIAGTDPAGNDTIALSRGVARLGDIDGDGYADFAISAMLADPEDRIDAGEVYVLYGGPRPSDCNGNGVFDNLDIDPNDPDGDGFVSPDCNGNGVPDECDIDPNDPDDNGILSPDCNNNGVPDECDVLDGSSEDCNGNEVPDECEVYFFFEASPELGPIGDGVPQSHVIISPPRTGSDVHLNFEAIGDLGAITEWVDLDINGVPVGRVFMNTGHECPAEPDTDALDVPAETYNAAVNNSDAVINMIASNAVDPDWCPESWIAVTIQYQAVGPGDCNGNGVPDICDILYGTSPDENGNGIPDECEPDCLGDLDGDNDVDLADLAQLLGSYGETSGVAYEDGDLDGDGDVDLSDLSALLAVYGTTCD